MSVLLVGALVARLNRAVSLLSTSLSSSVDVLQHKRRLAKNQNPAKLGFRAKAFIEHFADVRSSFHQSVQVILIGIAASW